MFVRKKRNKSGSVSVQVIDKSNGYHVVKTIGAACDPAEVNRLAEVGKAFIVRQSKQYSLFPRDEHDNAVILDFVRSLSNVSIRTIGPELIFGRLFDEIGFGVIPEQLFRDIVVARLVYPSSKLKTVDYLYPIGYDIFEGNTFEGKTLLPVLKGIQKRYNFGKPVVVADAAMLSQDNLEMLNRQKYPFIVAARIRNETQAVQDDILQRCNGLTNGQSVEIIRNDGYRLIVAYSDQRAKKDAHNRQRGLTRLRKRLGSGRMTKEHLNNRGYNKFLKLSGEVSVEIDEAKVEQAVQWDGLKGYLTNTKLSVAEVIENYGQLWHVEKAFRISKTDLRIRPMYHRRRKRIEAHVLVAFVAYTIYKELERRLHEVGIAMSPNRAAELSQTMYEMSFRLPNDPEQKQIILKMDADQQQLYDLIY